MKNSLVVNGQKLCSVCKVLKPTSEYYYCRTKEQLFGPCKSCNKNRSTSWRKRNPDRSRAQNRAWYKRNPEAARRIWLKKHYNMTPQQYNNLLAAQGGGCAICAGTSKLHIDHCHTTKKIRGILCSNCNLGIGNLQENREIMKRAIAYLYPTVSH